MIAISGGINFLGTSDKCILDLIEEARLKINEGGDESELIVFIQGAEAELKRRKSFEQK